MGNGTQLGRVRGLGSAKTGTDHFWKSRVTAVSNALLMIWFVVSLLRLPSLDFIAVRTWMHQPIVAIPMLLLVGSVFWHFRMGVQVWIEDYTHNEGSKVLSILALNLYTVAAAATAVFCILKVAFGACSWPTPTRLPTMSMMPSSSAPAGPACARRWGSPRRG